MTLVAGPNISGLATPGEAPTWRLPSDNDRTVEIMQAGEFGFAAWIGVNGLYRMAQTLGAPAYRHSLRTAIINGMVHEAVDGDADQAKLDGLLHDIGKGVPVIRRLSEEPRALTRMEQLAMRAHPLLSEQGIRALARAADDPQIAERIRAAAPVARYHHTKPDAMPHGLIERVLPVQMADVADALTSPGDRPYLIQKGEFATPDGRVIVDAVVGQMRDVFPVRIAAIGVDDVLDVTFDLKGIR